jgi:hypothetical protein
MSRLVITGCFNIENKEKVLAIVSTINQINHQEIYHFINSFFIGHERWRGISYSPTNNNAMFSNWVGIDDHYLRSTTREKEEEQHRSTYGRIPLTD